MGHKIKRKVFALTFEGHPDLEGANVMVRSIPFGAMTAMFSAAVAASAGDGTLANLGADDAAQMVGIFGKFAEALVEWDLEDEDGTPIPATLEGLNSLDSDVAMAVVEPWLSAVQGVRPGSPLPNGSGSGTTSVAASLPMEPLSTNPPS